MSASDLVYCRVCGGIMPDFGRDICPKCYKAEEELFRKVKQYLRRNSRAEPAEIAEACECTVKEIIAFMESGRLAQAGASFERPCQMCGRKITDGKVCFSCKNAVMGQITNLEGAAKPTPPPPADEPSGAASLVEKTKKKREEGKGHVGKKI